MFRGGGVQCWSTYLHKYNNNQNSNYPSADPLTLLVNCTVANNKLRYIAASSIEWGGAGINRYSSFDQDYSFDPVQIMNSIIYNNTVVGEESSSGAYYKMNLSNYVNHWGSGESTIGYSFIEHYDVAQIEGDEIYDY